MKKYYLFIIGLILLVSCKSKNAKPVEAFQPNRVSTQELVDQKMTDLDNRARIILYKVSFDEPVQCLSVEKKLYYGYLGLQLDTAYSDGDTLVLFYNFLHHDTVVSPCSKDRVVVRGVSFNKQTGVFLGALVSVGYLNSSVMTEPVSVQRVKKFKGDLNSLHPLFLKYLTDSVQLKL